MKKKRVFASIGAAILAVFLMVFFATSAFAAEGDAVSIELTSNKDSYDAGEEATFTLTVENAGAGPLEAVEYAFSLPEGVSLADGQVLEGTLGAVDAGDKAMANVNVRMPENQGAGSGEEHPTDPDDPTDTGGNPEDVGNDDNESDDAHQGTGLPAAGDAALAAAIVLGVAGVAALIAGKWSRGAYIALLFACGIAAGAAGMPATAAYAEQNAETTRTVERTVTVDGKPVTVAVAVTYRVDGGGQPTDPDDPDQGGDDGTGVSIEYQPQVWVFDKYEVTDEGYVVSEDEMRAVAKEMASRSQASQPVASSARVWAALTNENDSGSIYQGATCAFTGNDDDPEGGAGTVTTVVWRTNELHKPEALIRIEQERDPRKVFESLSVVDPFRPIDISCASFVEGVEPTDDPGGLDKINLTIKKKLSTGDTFEGTFTLDPRLDVDVKWTLLSGFERFKVLLGFDGTATGSFNVKGVNEDIPLLSEPFVVQISHGVNVAFDIKLHIQADGSASIGVELHNVMGVGYIDGEFRSLDEDDDEEIGQSWDLVDPRVDCTLRLGIHPYATLRMLKIEIADLEFGVGGDASGSYVERPTGMTCCSVNAYIYAEFSVGRNTSWMKEVGLSGGPWVIWDENSSPIPIHGHFEDGKYVDECTYGDMEVPGEDPDEVTPAEDFAYEVYDDHVEITGYIGGGDFIKVPVMIEGKPVTDMVVGTRYPAACKAKKLVLEEGSQLKNFAEEISDESAFEEIDLSGSSKLEDVNVLGKQVTLTLGDAPNLRFLGARDLANPEFSVEGYEALEHFNFEDCATSKLTLGYLPNLTYLGIGWYDIMPLEEIDLSGCVALKTFWLTATNIKDLDLSVCPSLEEVHVSGDVKELILDNPNLRVLEFISADLSSLDASKCPALEELDCCDLTSINLSGCASLRELNCMGLDRKLKELDISDCTALERLWCHQNLLTELDISNNPALTYIKCENNPLEDTTALRAWGAEPGHELLID